MDAVLDNLYGEVGTPQREEFRKEAFAYCLAQSSKKYEITPRNKHKHLVENGKIVVLNLVENGISAK